MRTTFLLAALLLTPSVHAQPLEQPDLVFEVRLGTHLVSDAIPSYQQGEDIYLPLCELSRLLTIAIRCEPGDARASGYILDEQRGFHLDADALGVTVEGRRATLEARDLLRKGDDIYIASRLLTRWLPVDLAIDMPNLTVQVRAREKLPLQGRLERQAKEKNGARAGQGTGGFASGFTRVETPYRIADVPFIDQTLSLDLRRGASTAGYSAYASADLLGMEAALYVARTTQYGGPSARLTLGRHEPDGGLLGPLRARTALIGSVTAPAVPHIAYGSVGGTGFTLSNRVLWQAPLMDTHSLRGDLGPGWDVELYYNDALVGLQQPRADGKYSFEDLPLNYGANDFRLVFHGPLGQMRVERHSFLLENSLLAPGELVYHLTSQRSSTGGARSVATFDWGLSKQLALNGTLVHLNRYGQDQRFASLALNAYWHAVIASATVVQAADGGRLAQLAFRTRVAGVAISASRAMADGFVSDLYQAGPNPVRLRDEIRLDGYFARVSFAAHAKRDQRAQGDETREASLRMSTFRFGTAFSNAVRWHAGFGPAQADGMLQASRRVAGIGLSGQAMYQIRPHAALSALSLSADKHLWPGYLLNLGATRSFVDPHYRFSAAVNKGLGRFGMGIGAFHTSRGDYGATVQLFTALGREPRRALWAADALPMAASGAASILVYLDRNRNGIMDGADEPVRGAGFAINGGAHLARTDAGGIAYLSRLNANQFLDIAVDTGTLEDPQWQAQNKGMRIVPRAGKVSQLDFAIGITGEIDGTTYLVDKGVKRPIGGVELRLVDGQGVVAASTTSMSDGYYVIAGVLPGRYRLEVSPDQLSRLGMQRAPSYPAAHELTMAEDGTFINGKDLVIARLDGQTAAAVTADHASSISRQ